eukprot:11860_1
MSDRLKQLLSQLNSGLTISNQSTEYSKDVTTKYEKIKKNMNFLYDGLKSTVLSELSLYHKRNDTDISKMNVVDIACGDGNYCRLVSNKFNYNKVVGIDISESQIASAKQKTDTNIYPNIQYECVDASLFDTENENKYFESFDIGLAIWFYNYANTKNKLENYIRSTYNIMKPDSFLIGATRSVENINKCKTGYFQNNPKLGMFVSFKDNLIREGPITSIYGYQPHTMQINTNLYEHSTYKSLFKKVGFKSMEFLIAEKYKYGINSTKYEQRMFKMLFDRKYIQQNYWQIFIAHK